MHKFIYSLSKKALIAVLIILLPIFITFIYSYSINKKQSKEQVLNDLTISAEAFEGEVYQYLEMSKRSALDFASDGYISSELERLLHKRGKNVDDLSRHLVRNKLPLARHIHSIYVTDLKGKVVASTDPRLLGSNMSGDESFMNGRQGLALTEKGIEFEGRPGLLISAPVRGRTTGRPVGVLTNLIMLSELEKVLTGEFIKELGALSWNRGRTETMEAYLVNRDRLMLTRSRFVKDSVLRQVVDTAPVRACLEHDGEISGYYKDYRGVEVAGASMCIPALKWTLLFEVDEKEAMEPVAAMRRQALYTTLIVGGLIGLLFLIFHRSIVQQLRNICLAAKRIAGGDYGVKIPVRSTDEIGTLSECFNNMAGEIQARTLELKESEERLKAILDNSTALVHLKDTEGRYLFVNKRHEQLFKTDRNQLSGKTVYDIFPTDAAEKMREADLKVLETGKPLESEDHVPQEDGVHVYLTTKFPLFDTKGEPYGVCGFSTDITGRKRAEEALKESEELLKNAQRIAHLGSWDWDITGNSLVWSDEIYRIFGLKPQEFGATYEAFLNSVHPADREFVKVSVKDALFKKTPYSIDHRIILPDGKVRSVHEAADVNFDSEGRPVRMVGTVQDITERRQTEFELKKLSTALDQSVNIIFITDVHGNIEYVNPTFEKVTGYSRQDALSQNPRILASGEIPHEKYEELWKTILSGKTWRNVQKNKRKTGGYYWCECIISPIKNERGEITHFLSVQEDITERVAAEERVKYLAQYDGLTGLINRSRFMELMDEWIGRARDRGLRGALCLMDMDQFKLLNDTYGHGAGDEFLRRVAKLLQATLERVLDSNAHEKKPIIGRLSGDEFAVFLPFAGGDEAAGIADRLRAAVGEFRWAEVSVSLTISIGIALYPGHGSTTKELFTKADTAMFRAKELGRNRSYIYRPEDKDLEQMHSRLHWKEKILKALMESRFEPWFQPILDLKTNTVNHFEALARLKDEDGAILVPGAFIDIAERFGLIASIDRMIMEKTMALQARMKAGGRTLSFGMNLSGKDIGDEDLLSFIRSKISTTGADPNDLVFEITETAAINDFARAVQFIKSLKSLGCHFALDDFGVGFTSFNYLKEMQVDYIKIDGSFIKKLHENPDDQVFVKAITDVAKGLKIKSVAEFVETEDTLRLLREIGVDYAQGYLIGKPAPGLGSADMFLKTLPADV
ncbi:MAG: EAL domain-containing protein [Deltaproteobacteria bacterium]|nr:EAL domain-containing protein [Deltaproteobacteria bacterium]